MCGCGSGRGMDGTGVFSPLWLCLWCQPLHGRTLPVVAADVVVVVVVVTMVMCVYGRGRGMDGAGVFSPLWLCLQYQPLHGLILPVVVADVVVVVVVVVVVTMVMCVWQRTGYGRSWNVQYTMAVLMVPAAT